MTMDLKEMIEAAINKEMAENMQKHVDEAAAKMVKELVQDQFRSYGPLKKQVEKELESALKIDLSQAKIESINDYMSNVVAKELHTFIQANCGTNLQEMIFSNLKISDLKEIKLSEIVAKFAEEIKGEIGYGETQEFTVHVQESDAVNGFHHLYFSEEPNQRPHGCDFHLSINDEGIPYSFRCDKSLKKYYGFERLLWALEVNKTKIILDDYDTTIYSEYDD